MKKESLPVESMVSVSHVVKTIRRERLIRQVAYFLMLTIAGTLTILVLQSLAILTLPNNVAERLWMFFGLQTFALLAIIVRRLTSLQPD